MDMLDETASKNIGLAPQEKTAPRVVNSLIDTMSALLLEERQIRAQVAIATIAVAFTTWLRFFVDDVLPEGFPFVTFFPAVLVTALFASVRAAIVVALVTAVISLVFFIPPYGGVAMSGPVVIAMLFFLAITATEIFFISLSGFALQRIKAERDKSQWLAQSRDLMFSELQHRVSNNLANVASLLRLQASATSAPEARAALTSSMARVQTVARVQRNLYQADEQEVEVRSFLTQLASDTQETMTSDHPVTVKVNADKFKIKRDHAVPFGLIASEMIMNAIEHGRQDDKDMLIEVCCTRTPAKDDSPAMVRLQIADNGPGLPENAPDPTTSSLGMSISNGFAHSLGGEITLANRDDKKGAVATLSFPVQQDS
jgi:two-component sensor histidine kinase